MVGGKVFEPFGDKEDFKVLYHLNPLSGVPWGTLNTIL